MGPLSEAERGIRRLRREEEDRRVAALKKLRTAATEVRE
jgi:hypothetical protein